MTNLPIDGKPFRLNYQRPALLVADSDKMRRRLLENARAQLDGIHHRFAPFIQQQLGVEYFASSPQRFWMHQEIGDVLSAITHLIQFVSTVRGNSYGEKLHAVIKTIFQEESVRYRLDDKGGVHYAVDQAFEHDVDSVLQGLGKQKFSGAKAEFVAALEAMSPQKQSGKRLIRDMFAAVETAFLVVVQNGSINRLNEQNLKAHFRPLLLNRHAGIEGADDKVDRLLGVYFSWINAAHLYRHGGNFEQIHEAPMDIAVSMATQGMAFLRHLCEF